ncbi:MAG: ATP-dependent Clp protease ATP-binding subunit [Clostridia bacterium]|nr:ATP-dependent Clp protease ATP-binding subunit [Clostridia bacterium]
METERVIQTLTRRSKNKPVLVGEPGVGKTAVVEGLALAIVKGRVPAELQGKRLVELDIASMVSGTRFRGDFEERLTNTINQVIAEGNIILFIDEIHNMVGAGSTSDNSMDAAEILKPALARGELRIIGATTTREYRKYIEKDPALERRFQPIMVEEPSPELAIQIVKGVKSKYENHHNVIITDEAIKAAVELSVRYVNDRFLPDKAFDIIDESCSKLKISTFAVPKHLIDLAAELTTLKRKLDLVRLNDPQQAAVMEEKYANLLHEYEYAQFDYNQQVEEYKCKLTANDVRLVVSQMTGVPVAELSREEKDKLVHLEQELARRVIGQEEAVKVVSRAVKRQRAGIKDPNRPIGSFIFVGPTGVGKTELAKALSDLLFGSNSEVVRIDMSEYMDKQSTAKLIGAPPGYVGYDESGYLTEKIRTKPYSVVLFDEIEKAHPDVFNLLLQILDEGRLTDSHGKTVNFRNTVIILTSNIGISDSTSSFGFATKDSYETLKDNVERALKKFFRPEFLNRLDEIVLFNYLDEQSTIKITELLCFGLYKRLKGTLNLKFTDNAIALIAQQGYDKNNGARPLKRAIQRQVEDALAEKLLTGEIAQGNTVVVDAQNGKIIFTKG